MIFDQLCGMVERVPEFSGLRKAVSQCKLFYLNVSGEVWPDELPACFDTETQTFLSNNFFLPFPCVAVEDKTSVIILADGEFEQRGLSGVRHWIMARRPRLPGSADTTFDVSAGTIEDISFDNGKHWKCVFQIASVYTLVDGKMQQIPEAPFLGHFHHDILFAIQELFYINTPSRFVMETSPTRQRVEKPGHILRSPDRPIYTVLAPTEIRKRMALPVPPQGGTKRPHERRSHYRTLASNHFKNKQGQVILIPACWIGPSENVVGNKRYRVILD